MATASSSAASVPICLSFAADSKLSSSAFGIRPLSGEHVEQPFVMLLHRLHLLSALKPSGRMLLHEGGIGIGPRPAVANAITGGKQLMGGPQRGSGQSRFGGNV
jgi:hypothetical protein